MLQNPPDRKARKRCVQFNYSRRPTITPMNKIANNRFEKQTHRDVSFIDMNYVNCVFYNCSFINAKWINCKFKNTSMLGNTNFENCKFENCKFHGQHTNLGGPSLYSKCDFINIDFKNIFFILIIS